MAEGSSLTPLEEHGSLSAIKLLRVSAIPGSSSFETLFGLLRERGEASSRQSALAASSRVLGLALESRDLPDEGMAGIGAAESTFLNNLMHPRRRVRERPELHSSNLKNKFCEAIKRRENRLRLG